MGELLTLDPRLIDIPERIRDIDPEHLFDLKNSIAEIGQQTPITVVRKGGRYELVAGLHRLKACEELGIPVKAIVLPEIPSSELEDEELRKLAVEIAENTARKDFSMEEKQRAIYEFHQLLLKRNPSHTVSKTARILGMNRSYVSELINAYEQGITGKTFREIRQKRKKQEEVSQQIAEIITKQQFIKSRDALDIHLRNGNAFALMNEPDLKNKFTFILTDIPYGISVNETAYLKDYTEFDDGSEWMTEPRIIQIIKLFHYLLNEDKGWVVAFCSLEQWYIAKKLIDEVEDPPLQILKFPLIWHKTTSAPPVQTRYQLGHAYEVAMVLKRPNTEVFLKGTTDVIYVERLTDKRHPTEKPVELGKEILKRLTLPLGTGIDPFAGSGALAQAMREYGLETYAVELNPHYYEVMKTRFEEAGYDVKEF